MFLFSFFYCFGVCLMKSSVATSFFCNGSVRLRFLRVIDETDFWQLMFDTIALYEVRSFPSATKASSRRQRGKHFLSTILSQPKAFDSNCTCRQMFSSQSFSNVNTILSVFRFYNTHQQDTTETMKFFDSRMFRNMQFVCRRSDKMIQKNCSDTESYRPFTRTQFIDFNKHQIFFDRNHRN